MNWKRERLQTTQPFFIRSAHDLRQEIYQNQGISHFYTFTVSGDGHLAAVPDGCFDLVFLYRNGTMKAYAAGPILSFNDTVWPVGAELFGVCFFPGVHPVGMQKTMREFTDRIEVIDENIWNMDILREMETKTGFRERIRTFLEEYSKLEKEQVRPFGKLELVMSVKNMIYNSDGKIRIAELAEKIGYSERYVNKVFMEQMGFSPKNFCKIIQFQRAMEYLNNGAPGKMTEAAIELGYYDQPQFIRDFERYAGITPTKYLKFIEEFREE